MTTTQPFQKLPFLPPASTFLHPTKRINNGPDVSTFLTSLAYRDIGLWILQLNRSLIPRQFSRTKPPTVFTLADYADDSQCPDSVVRVRKILREVDSWLAEAPVDDAVKHRFGNPAFRKWMGVVRERARALLTGVAGVVEEGKKKEREVTATATATALDELVEYFVGGLGSAERLDYGTGHELSFLAFLGGLWKLGFFADGEQDGPIERAIVLGTLEPYLVLIRKVILLYRLEPAGSHGVWGLDDHFFLSYIFGSAQLSRPLTSPTSPTPLEGSYTVAPPPTAVTTAALATPHAPTNMYFSAIAFIHAVKRGPFGEHSPVLYDISGITAGWGKINKGMIKMYNAEVLSKFPVVQHFRFGTLFSWSPDPDATTPSSTVHLQNQPQTLFTTPPTTTTRPSSVTAMPPNSAGTQAPWATGGAVTGRAPPSGTAAWVEATRMPAGTSTAGIPYSRTPAPPSGRSTPGMPDTSRQSVTRAPWGEMK